MKPRAVVFDAYGTLFDVHSVVLHACDGIGDDLHSLSTLWRQKQLEFTWLRALMGRYEDFWNVTEAALRSAVRQLKIQASEARVDSLMQAYLIPSAFPDVRRALEHLKGFPLAILSNGTPKMFINIGSVLALAPEYGAAVYGATKAFVLFLSQALQAELAPKGVYVQAVLPAATRTEIWERSGKDVNNLPA